MQKKILGTLLALCMLLTVLPFALTAGAADEEYIKIGTADELIMLMNQQEGYPWTANYVLTADIKLDEVTAATTGLSQAPIGNATTMYSGTFDGDGHTISGIDITSEGTDVGLFGMAIDATICDLTIDGTINGGNYTGGFVGFGKNLTITNCVNECIVTGSNFVGGIIGALGSNADTPRNATSSGSIIGCRNKGEISGVQYVGGIVAYMRTTGTVTVSECMNENTVNATASQSDVGGIAGIAWGVKNSGYVTVSDCINTAEVSGYTKNIGGIVGRAHEINDIQYCYNAGETTCTATENTSQVDAIVGSWTKRTTTTTAATAVTGNYYTKGTTDTDCGGVSVTENIGVASSYADATNGALNTNYKWFFTEDGPVLERFATVTEIADADSLYELMGKTVNGYYRLTCDIDLSKLEEDKTQSPIASFSGVFDGNGYTISGINLVVGTESSNGFGLFGNAKNAKIHDLTIEGTIDGENLYWVGGIVGNGTLAADEYLYISGCTNKCTVSGKQYVGGIVGGFGENVSTLSIGQSKGTVTITSCRNLGTVSATNQVGGIVGYIYSTATSTHTITECMNSGTVSGSSTSGNSDAGGILGCGWGTTNATSCTVSNCINIGSISVENACVGGILGRGYSVYSVANCYNSGSTTGKSNVGAIAGSGKSASVTKCYYSSGGTNANGTYVDIDDKANADTYTDWSADIWTFTSAGPRLTSFVVEIDNAGAFAALMQNSDEWGDGNFYILTADIDLTDVTEQNPIGDATTPFVGGFDGAGHTISGISITGTSDNVGLFGMAENATFCNLTIIGTVDGGTQSYVGGLVGNGKNAYIENCVNNCNVTGKTHAGGIVGVVGTSDSASKGSIIECKNTGNISAERYVGGIIGYTRSYETVTIKECMNAGAVEATSTVQGDVGGIAGILYGIYANSKEGVVSVSDCINIGNVTAAASRAGGIVGRTAVNSSGGINKIEHCYNNGTVSGTGNAFVIVGDPDSRLISNADKTLNYYTADADKNTRFGTFVAKANIDDASKYATLNANNAWVITDVGPRLKCFTVEISAEVVATTGNTVTVDLYAESGVPFWGALINIETGEGLTLADDGVVIKDIADFTCTVSEDGSTVALCQMEVSGSTLTKTKIATLTYTVAAEATGDQAITVTVSEAYDVAEKVVDAYGDSTSISTDLLGVTYGHGVVLYSEYVLEYTIKTEKLDSISVGNCFMLFESTDANGKTVATVVDAYEMNGRYRFSAPGIAAKNMGDEVKGTFFYEDAEGDRHYGYTDTYNLVDYYNVMYKKAANYDGLGTLLNAMLNYGAAAQTYFGYDTDNLVSDSIPEDYTAAYKEASKETTRGEATDWTYAAAGSAAVLNQRIELVLYFTLNAETALDASKLVFKGEYEDINGEKQTFTISGDAFEVALDGTITVYIDQIAAKDLRQMVTGALYQGDTQVSQSVTTSFECYAKDNTDASVATLCKAILAYIDAAAAYLKK